MSVLGCAGPCSLMSDPMDAHPWLGSLHHPSRHSAGQPIVAGWAFQWICQLGFDRDSRTAPVDAHRLHPLDDADQTAAQVRELLSRLDPGGTVPLVVFDAGYDSAQLTLDLATERAAVLGVSMARKGQRPTLWSTKVKPRSARLSG
jgi:hypothetical protein